MLGVVSKWLHKDLNLLIYDEPTKGIDISAKEDIFNNDDKSAIGAGQALKKAGTKDKVYVIGLGGSIDGLQAIKEGLIDRTTYMSVVEEGYLAMETAVKYLNGEEVSLATEIMQVEVNKDNVEGLKGEW